MSSESENSQEKKLLYSRIEVLDIASKLAAALLTDPNCGFSSVTDRADTIVDVAKKIIDQVDSDPEIGGVE